MTKPKDPFCPTLFGRAFLQYLFNREIPQDHQGKWFPFKTADTGVYLYRRADGTLRQEIMVLKGGVVMVTVWDVKEGEPVSAIYNKLGDRFQLDIDTTPHTPTDDNSFVINPQQIRRGDNRADMFVVFKFEVPVNFAESGLISGERPNPFCEIATSEAQDL